jgi:hypothetical protein
MASKTESSSKPHPSHHYGLLLASILLLLLVLPILNYQYERESIPLLSVLVLIVLFAAIYSASRERPSIFYVSIALAILTIAAHGVDLASDAVMTAAYRSMADSAFYFYIAVIIALHVLRSRRVTTDILLGAVCVYLMLGLAWAGLYEFAELVWPGSLRSSEPLFLGTVEDGTLRGTGFVYYSFVTLSTLGYGDVSPVTPPARVFAWMEAVVGQIFLVIAVARLVSLNVAGAARRAED